MFSAYTIKKVLPRLLIAVILIQLSWWITTFAIQVNNDIAHGLEALFYAPFGGIKNMTINAITGPLNAGDFAATGLFAGAAAGITFVAAGASSLLGVFALALTAILGILIALFTLILRKAVLIMLIVIAPLAFVAWVLPGTEKFWKMWYESFSKLLLMYPLIILMVASGKIFAHVASKMDGTNQFAQFAMIVIGFFGPLLLIPATLKMSGSAFSALSGAVNNRGKGVFDRLKGVRANEAQKIQQKSKNYQRFGDRNKFATGMSTAFGALSNPRDAMRGRAGIRSGRQTGRTVLGAETLKNDPTFAAYQQDDNFLLALANENLARQKIAAAEAKYDAARLAGDSEGMNEARADADARRGALNNAMRVTSRHSGSTRLTALNALARTGYQFAPGEQGYQELASTVESITGGDKGAYAAAMNEAQYHLKSAGRADLGGINAGANLDIKSGIRKLSNYQRGQGKGDTYKGGAEAWLGTGSAGKDSAQIASDLASSLATEADPVKLQERLDSVAEWHSMLLSDMPSATDANKLEIQKQIAAIELMQRLPTTGIPTESLEGLGSTLNTNRRTARGYNPNPDQMDQ